MNEDKGLERLIKQIKSDYTSLKRDYDKETLRERRFVLLHPSDIVLIAEYWNTKRRKWLEYVLKNPASPSKAFSLLFEQLHEDPDATSADIREAWAMFLSFGFLPEQGKRVDEMSPEDFEAIGMPSDLERQPDNERFYYPRGIVNPKHRSSKSYVISVIAVGSLVERYRAKSIKKMSSQTRLLAYWTAYKVSNHYNMSFAEIFFDLDSPDIPDKLRTRLYALKASYGVIEGEGERVEVPASAEPPPLPPREILAVPPTFIPPIPVMAPPASVQVQIAIETTRDLESISADEAIATYRSSVAQVEDNLDNQNKEIIEAMDKMEELRKEMTDVANNLEACRIRLKNMGVEETAEQLAASKRDIDEMREKASQVEASLADSSKSNAEASRVLEKTPELAQQKRQDKRFLLLEQIQQGIEFNKAQADQLGGEATLQGRENLVEAETASGIFTQIKRAVLKKGAGMRSSTAPGSSSSFGSEEDLESKAFSVNPVDFTYTESAYEGTDIRHYRVNPAFLRMLDEQDEQIARALETLKLY